MAVKEDEVEQYNDSDCGEIELGDASRMTKNKAGDESKENPGNFAACCEGYCIGRQQANKQGDKERLIKCDSCDKIFHYQTCGTFGFAYPSLCCNCMIKRVPKRANQLEVSNRVKKCPQILSVLLLITRIAILFLAVLAAFLFWIPAAWMALALVSIPQANKLCQEYVNRGVLVKGTVVREWVEFQYPPESDIGDSPPDSQLYAVIEYTFPGKGESSDTHKMKFKLGSCKCVIPGLDFGRHMGGASTVELMLLADRPASPVLLKAMYSNFLVTPSWRFAIISFLNLVLCLLYIAASAAIISVSIRNCRNDGEGRDIGWLFGGSQIIVCVIGVAFFKRCESLDTSISRLTRGGSL